MDCLLSYFALPAKVQRNNAIKTYNGHGRGLSWCVTVPICITFREVSLQHMNKKWFRQKSLIPPMVDSASNTNMAWPDFYGR